MLGKHMRLLCPTKFRLVNSVNEAYAKFLVTKVTGSGANCTTTRLRLPLPLGSTSAKLDGQPHPGDRVGGCSHVGVRLSGRNDCPSARQSRPARSTHFARCIGHSICARELPVDPPVLACALSGIAGRYSNISVACSAGGPRTERQLAGFRHSSFSWTCGRFTLV